MLLSNQIWSFLHRDQELSKRHLIEFWLHFLWNCLGSHMVSAFSRRTFALKERTNWSMLFTMSLRNKNQKLYKKGSFSWKKTSTIPNLGRIQCNMMPLGEISLHGRILPQREKAKSRNKMKSLKVETTIFLLGVRVETGEVMLHHQIVMNINWSGCNLYILYALGSWKVRSPNKFKSLPNWKNVMEKEILTNTYNLLMNDLTTTVPTKLPTTDHWH